MASRTSSSPHHSNFPLLRPPEAAAYLGLTRSSFRRRVIEKKLIPYLIDTSNNQRAYRREDLDAYIADHYTYHPAGGAPAAMAQGQTTRSARRHAGKAGR